ncbi:MAG: hypothetical protein A2Z24_02285 [Candidatus Woykebacteria bacterium RBG_16_44_10]|uniref:Uncharacterized protein n=1 Tax=Candidatus Woykebacteria bacterium RBG_16_44_10 TaxID=1802597 RepID=A0A1G1WFZ5_9BACT|nr:MAG: hypothetical protein A2Z24_02285 [Candidatus Woykebacteria bacterium RBG_16_44_10]
MARTGSATVKTPQGADEKTLSQTPQAADQNESVVDLQVAEEAVQVPEGGLVIATASGEVRTVKLCRGCGVELPPDWPHNYCEECHQEWLWQADEARLPEGKTFCSGQTTDGKPCRRVVDRGPDGTPQRCVKCDAIRVLVGAKASIAGADNRDWVVPEEARAKLAEAEECFLSARYIEARNAARRVHHLQAKARVEYRLSQIREARLGHAELAEYDRAQQLYEAEDYFGASRALNTLREISRREQRSRELDQITERAVSSTFELGRGDRGSSRRRDDQHRREKSEKDQRIRLGMRGSNSSPSRGRGHRQ